jgi:pimeloyl-ACP methyl ester carboxylesterase
VARATRSALKRGYDKKTMARDIRELVHQLGHDERVQVVGHDIGLMVAYAYTADEVSKVILMDAFLPGVGDWTHGWLLRDLWHFHFYGETPLALVKGRERAAARPAPGMWIAQVIMTKLDRAGLAQDRSNHLEES